MFIPPPPFARLPGVSVKIGGPLPSGSLFDVKITKSPAYSCRAKAKKLIFNQWARYKLSKYIISLYMSCKSVASKWPH